MSLRPATPADAAAIARVHVDAWRETYTGIVPDAYLASLDYAARAARWRERLTTPGAGECICVAADVAGQIVGFAGGGPQRTAIPGYTGELYAIYLLRAAQGQGAGRHLTRAVAARLAELDMRSLVVWVLAANPSRGFYEALGGQLVAEQPIAIGGVSLHEVAYGWSDLAPLLAPAAP
jgi:L-amino acid N-acyltransferase YncA